MNVATPDTDTTVMCLKDELFLLYGTRRMYVTGKACIQPSQWIAGSQRLKYATIHDINNSILAEKSVSERRD